MADHFERLGLPRRFSIDRAELERAYLARSREVHPDYHRLGASAEQAASLELTAALNEAYATLRDPFRRAEYLLALLGGPSASEARDMDPAFLMETLELRERIEEVRAAAGPDSPERTGLETELQDRYDGLLQEVAARFQAAEAGDGSALAGARKGLNAAKYVQGLLRDLRAD
jgi:molecular chaperone HscB